MNPYALSCMHAGNLDLYRLALAAASEPVDIVLLARLIGMEGTLLAAANDLLGDVAQLRLAQQALCRPPASRPALRIV